MGKPSAPRALPENEAKAVARNLRVSPQKLNLLAQLIRGKKVSTALADLEFSRKRISTDVRKCLQSAIANAENNHDLDVDDLVVSQAFVGKALVMKRFHARARGRGARIMKPFPATAPQEKSHVRSWRSKGHLAPLMRPTKFPEIPVSLERNTEVFRHPLL